jgi:hypothetical protein
MRQLSTLGVFGALAVAACGAGETTGAPDGVVFVAPSGDYSITFPGQPTVEDSAISVDGQSTGAATYVFEDGTDAAYITSMVAYDGTMRAGDSAAVLERARDGALGQIGATLTSSEFVENNDVPGVSFTFTVSNGADDGVGRAVAYFDDPRLYLSFALGASDGAEEFDVFVDSFTFALSTEAGS